jgi:hypothetical protein
MQMRIEEEGGKMTELREADSRVPDRVATFRDLEGNGFELQHIGFPAARFDANCRQEYDYGSPRCIA